MMKIAIDCRFWGTKHTGLGRYTQNLVSHILSTDRESKYYLLCREQDRADLKNLFPKAEIILCEAGHYSLKEQLLVPFVLAKLKINLVHFTHFNVPILYFGNGVVTIHDLIKHKYRGLSTSTKNPITYFLKYFFYHLTVLKAVWWAKKIITPSLFVKKEILKYYSFLDPLKIIPIYEGVGFEFKKLRQTKATTISKKYALKRPFFIYVGNLYPHKNIDRLILALRKLNRETGVQLVISSERNVFFERMEKRVRQLQATKFVNFTGFIPDIDLGRILRSAVAFVTPSLIEGFGLPGLEAMACSTLVLASRAGSLTEIYGDVALYFDPEDIDQILVCLKQALEMSSSDRKKFISRGLKRIKRFNWQKCAEETIKVYKNQ